ncbi:WXG100 family type VII secretion target [Streptomyces sp. 6N223]|uniref:WXG100 family type VII secretion target n=1 Tax=Streptomyces sp. 6N223 TaxID=3457412 RepID=UPI003FD07CD2
MSEAGDLRHRAEQLRGLAGDVEGLLSNARSYVNNDMATWEGPNKEEVSGAITTWNTECGTVASDLRGLADSLDSQADDAEERENEDDEGD